MKEFGFLAREEYKIQFSDIHEPVYASMLINKLEVEGADSNLHKIEFSLLDFFPSFRGLEELENVLSDISSINEDRNKNMVLDLMQFKFGLNIDSEKNEIDLVEYYNSRMNSRLMNLTKADSLGSLPCIENYKIINGGKLHLFVIEVIPSKLISANAENIHKYVTLKEKMYPKFQKISKNILPGISYRKQLEFAKEYFENRQSKTGEVAFDFNLFEIPFRFALNSTKVRDEKFVLPNAFTALAPERILMPFFLEYLGLIDVNQIKLNNSPLVINDLSIVYSINKPSIKNKYFAKSFGLNPQKRKSLNESQIELWERCYLKLQEGACFIGRPEIEKTFCEIFYWLMKKITYCLEEPSFLKLKSKKWLEENSREKYVKMEDDFFLPFLHEKLKEEYGELISKKSEKFGGEADLLFSNIPLELKVRKNVKVSLMDMIDEKYKPASQSATYAAVTRLGFVIVLDLPQVDNKLINLDSCFHIIEKEFSGDSFKTQIVVCNFYCNLPKPSAALD